MGMYFFVYKEFGQFVNNAIKICSNNPGTSVTITAKGEDIKANKLE